MHMTTDNQALDVRSIRARCALLFGLGESQRDFARVIGVSQRTFENWEQGRRKPTGPARALLGLLQRSPEVILRMNKPSA
jgi:putative transcriptional regulator